MVVGVWVQGPYMGVKMGQHGTVCGISHTGVFVLVIVCGGWVWLVLSGVCGGKCVAFFFRIGG